MKADEHHSSNAAPFLAPTGCNSVHVWLHFHGSLGSLLSPERRGLQFLRTLPEPTSTKDLIESCGVPHTEVDRIRLNDGPVGFEALVSDGDTLAVFPIINSSDTSRLALLQPRPLRRLRFLADAHLGKLAHTMRLAGIDTAYSNHTSQTALCERMLEENRVLLTRNKRLLMRRVVNEGYLVRSDKPVPQFEEILQRFELLQALKPYTRCTHCNEKLESVDKDTVRAELEPLTERYYHEFSRCPGCRQIYWAGSHRARLHPTLQRLFSLPS